MAISITGGTTISAAGTYFYTITSDTGETVSGINVTCGQDSGSQYITNTNRSGNSFAITFADRATVPNGASFTITAYGTNSLGTSIRSMKSITYYNYKQYRSSIYNGGLVPYNIVEPGERITMQFSGPLDFTLTYPYSNMVISNASVTTEQRGGGYLKTLYFDVVSASKDGVITPTLTVYGTEVLKKSVYYNTPPTNAAVVRAGYFGATDISRYSPTLGAKLLYDGDTLYLNADSTSRNITVLVPTNWSILDVSTSDPWLSVTQSQVGTSAYTLEYTQNNSGSVRTCYLSVLVDTGDSTETTFITVSQGISSFTVNNSIECGGGSIITDIYGFSNPATREPVIEPPSWITMTANNFTVAANNSGYRESGDYIDFSLRNTGSQNKYTVWAYVEQRGKGTADFESTKSLPKAAGYAEIPFVGVYTNGLQTTSSAAWLTVDTFNPNLIRFTENTTGSDRTATLTWTYYGYDTVTLGTTTITQTGSNPTITVSPSSRTLANTEVSTTYTVTHPEGYSLDWSASGNVSFNRASSYFETVDSTTKILHVATNDNTTASSQTSTITVTGTSGASTIQSDSVTLVKLGTPGGITISPRSQTVSPSSGSIVYNVTCTNMQLNTLDTSVYDDTMIILGSSINALGTELTVWYGANNTATTKMAHISVYGTDIYGNNTSDYITLNQKAQPSVSVSPSSVTLGPTVQRAEYAVTYAPSGSTLSYTAVGDVSIDRSRTDFVTDPQTGITYLWVYTNNNTTTTTQTSTIWITAENDGVSASSTVTLVKQGTGGIITLNPSSQTVGAFSGSFTVNISTTNMNAQTLASSIVSGDLVGNVLLNTERTRATIHYTTNDSTSTERTAVVSIYGDDIYGNRQSANVTITQHKAAPTISVSPSTTTIAANDEYARYTVTHTAGVTLNYTTTGTISIDHTRFESIDTTHSYFYVYPNVNALSTSRQSTFEVTTAYYGETIESNEFTLVQQGAPGTVTLSPSTASVGGSSGSLEFDLSTYQMQTNTLATNVYSSTMNNVTAGFNSAKTKLLVTYGANTGSTSLSANVSVYGTDVWGDTRSGSVTITQNPKGTIAFNPASASVGYSAGTQIFGLTLNNVAADTITVSSNQSWATATYDSNTRQISVAYTDNGTGSSRTATITASGTDTYGVTITETATITQVQSGQISISCSPASRTLAYQESECFFYVNYTEGLQLSWAKRSGDLEIDTTRTRIEVDPTFGDTYFYVYTIDNDTSQTKTGTFILSASFGGQIYQSNTVTVYKTGVPGTLEVEPSTKTVSAVGGSTTFTVRPNGMNLSTMSVSVSSSTMNITSAALDSSCTVLTVVYGASTSVSQQSASITVSGQDYRGASLSRTVTLTQSGATPYLTITPNTYNAPSRSGVVEFSVDYFGINSNYTVTNPGSISGTISVNRQNNTITYSYNANTGTLPRTGQILVTGTRTDNQQQIVAAAVITQAAGVVNSILPIWENVEIIESPSSSFVEYHIDLDGDTIYAGKAYKYPGESDVTFTINDVASNYLGNGITFSNGCTQIPNYVKTFEVTTSGGTTYNQDIYNSWGYENTDYWLSDPIDYKVSCLQWLPVSIITTNWNSITVNNTAYGSLSRGKGYTAIQNLRNYALSNEISVYGADGTTRKYQISEGDYVLYYANAFGGWDSLLCNSTSKKVDNIETLSYRRKSSSISDFSKVDYQKNITPTWSLNTGIIQNGEKMYHLLESTMVYLHNLNTNEIIPVTITNSTCEYLNYTNNGKQPVKYNITVEESNQKMRK